MSEGTIVEVVTIPEVWPPLAPTVLVHKCLDSNVVKLWVDQSNAFFLQFSGDGMDSTPIRCQRVVLEASSVVVFIIRWGDSIKLNINRFCVEFDPDGSKCPIIVRARNVRDSSSVDFMFSRIDVNSVTCPVDRFFLETLKDLELKMCSGDRYQVVRSSALLRQLFIDESPLVHKVNSKYKHKLVFRVIEAAGNLPINDVHVHWVNIDPHGFSSANVVDLDLSKFLAAKILVYKGQSASVKDVIKLCSNSKGGVHYGSFYGVEQGVLQDYDDICRIIGSEPSLEAIIGIARVALSAVRPIVSAIVKDLS